MSTISRQRYHYLDVLRLGAIFGVLLIHVAAHYFFEWGRVPVSEWWAANVYHSLLRWCVPVFVLSTGATLLGNDQHETTRDFFRKRYSRLLLAFAFWQIFYGADYGWFSNWQVDIKSWAWWDRLIFGYSGYHLWYMQMILRVYLLIPLGRVLVKKMSQRQLWLMSGIWMGAVIVMTTWSFLGGVDYVNRETVFANKDWIFNYGPFLLGGYCLARLPWPTIRGRKIRPAWLMAVVIGTGVVNMIGNYWLLRTRGVWNESFDCYTGLLIAAQGWAVFAWAKTQEDRWRRWFAKERAVKFWKWFGRVSFGIYLTHLFFLDLTHYELFFARGGHWWWTIPADTLLLLGLSGATTWVITRIPLLRRVV